MITVGQEAPGGERCEGHNLRVLCRAKADSGRSIWQLKGAQRAARLRGRDFQRKEHWGE